MIYFHAFPLVKIWFHRLGPSKLSGMRRSHSNYPAIGNQNTHNFTEFSIIDEHCIKNGEEEGRWSRDKQANPLTAPYNTSSRSRRGRTFTDLSMELPRSQICQAEPLDLEHPSRAVSLSNIELQGSFEYLEPVENTVNSQESISEFREPFLSPAVYAEEEEKWAGGDDVFSDLEELYWCVLRESNGEETGSDMEERPRSTPELSRTPLCEAQSAAFSSMLKLAGMYWDQGFWEEATMLNETIVEVSIRRLGDNQFSLTAMETVALMYWNQGRWGDAITLEEQVVTRRRKLEGDEEVATLTSLAILDMMQNLLWDLLKE